jgi:hypothetical protein
MGATGTKLTVQLMSEMKRRDSKYGMVTMCIGGGMGARVSSRTCKISLTCRLLAVRFFGWPLDLRKRRGRGGFVNGSEWNHQYLDTNGIEIHYVRHGASLPLLLLHGWPEFWFGWRKNILPLAEAGFDVVAPDLRGFGDTKKTALPDPPRDLLKEYVEDLRGLADALGFESLGL